MLKSKLRDSDFKYPTIQDFFGVNVYFERFDTMPQREQDLLWQTANWMYIFFKIFSTTTNRNKGLRIPAKRKKGFALEVISKLVEGWSGMGSIWTKVYFSRSKLYWLIRL